MLNFLGHNKYIYTKQKQRSQGMAQIDSSSLSLQLGAPVMNKRSVWGIHEYCE